jgi:hypothetical protein
MSARDQFNADYVSVAASQTAAALGTGKVGEILERVVITPASTSPGAVTIIDGNSSVVVFAGGSSSVPNLVPITIQLGATARVATTPGWKITTGANVSVVAVGKFN